MTGKVARDPTIVAQLTVRDPPVWALIVTAAAVAGDRDPTRVIGRVLEFDWPAAAAAPTTREAVREVLVQRRGGEPASAA